MPGHIKLQLFIWLLMTTSVMAAADDAVPADVDAPGQTDHAAQYRTYIDSIVFSQGPYAAVLPEPLTALGIASRSQGDYSGAIQAFNQAMQTIRVNEGLYTANQLPVLELLVESHAALNQWSEVDAAFHYMYWIQRQAYRDSASELLPAIEKQIAWHYAAVYLARGATSAAHLLTASEFCEYGVALAGQHYGTDHPMVAEWLYRQALSLFYIAVAVQRGGDTGLELVNEMAYHQLRFGYDKTADWLVKKIYRQGMGIFKRISSIYGEPDGTGSEPAAMAVVYRADWSMLFNKHNHAAREYRDAYRLLEKSGVNPRSIIRYFSQPAVLPLEQYHSDIESGIASLLKYQHGMPASKETTEPRAASGWGTTGIIGWSRALPGLRMPAMGKLAIARPRLDNLAVASFDVDESGLAEGIDVTDYNREYRSSRNRAYEAIWSMQFRPRMENGVASRARVVNLNYIVPE